MARRDQRRPMHHRLVSAHTGRFVRLETRDYADEPREARRLLANLEQSLKESDSGHEHRNAGSRDTSTPETGPNRVT